MSILLILPIITDMLTMHIDFSKVIQHSTTCLYTVIPSSDFGDHMNKPKGLFIILILFASAYLTEIAFGQVEFSDQDKWAPVFEPNASYKDWTVYQRSIPSLETISPIEIKNINPGKSFFDWKTDRVSDHVDISFSVKGLSQASCKCKNWTRVYFYKTKAEDN